MDPKKDYYKILGVSEKASQDEIKKAYRRLAKEYHPDTHKGEKEAENRFKDISEAYSVLKDPKERQQYDLMRNNPFASGQGAGGRGGFDQGGGFRVNFGESGGSFGGIDDLLENFFGFGRKQSGFGGSSAEDIFGRTRTRRPQKGADIQSEITVPFELAARGGETMVQTPSGRRVKLKIPAGTEDGKKMKISGQGSSGPAGGAAGDLYVKINVAPHPDFERKGNNIYSTKKINMAEALLGTEIEVNTIENRKVKLKVPAGTNSGKLLRLKNLGIKSSNGRGDHLVRIEITTPDHLNNRSKKEFEEWAKKQGLIS